MVGVPHLTGRQKVYTAVVILASGPGKIKERLEAAYRLALAAIDAQLDIPPRLSGEFVKLRSELRKEFFNPTAGRFSSDNDRKKWASDAAARLVAFYDKLARFK